MKLASAGVARYYDRNTQGFLARGQGGSQGAIHRAVWGEGVSSRDEAFHFVHRLLRREMAELKATRILDLGCGTGASLGALLDRADTVGFGVTNSAVHARLAHERLGGRATIEEGDFCAEPLPAGIDLAFGIESFVHALDAKAFFENVARALRPSGRLALCDDFLENGKDHPWVRAFAEGWHASSLLRPETVDAIAAASGLELVEDRDFTPCLELDRPRDRLLGLVVRIARPAFRASLRGQSLAGGHALRQCLKHGLIHYRYRVWQKT